MKRSIIKCEATRWFIRRYAKTTTYWVQQLGNVLFIQHIVLVPLKMVVFTPNSTFKLFVRIWVYGVEVSGKAQSLYIENSYIPNT